MLQLYHLFDIDFHSIVWLNGSDISDKSSSFALSDMKRPFTKILQLPHQQEILFGLCILFCAISGILAAYDALICAESYAGCSIIFFLLLHLNSWLNPFIKKKLNKNYISLADGDDYGKAEQVMIGNGKDHYQGLSHSLRKKSVLGGRRTR